MLFKVVAVIMAGSLVVAAPFAQPKVLEGDALLQISKESTESSYDVKRGTTSDSLLQIAKESADSSYDVKRDSTSDRLLQISKDGHDSSYDV